MLIRIYYCKDGVYDVYDETSCRWLFSCLSADNVFSRLAKYGQIQIEFIDKYVQM